MAEITIGGRSIDPDAVKEVVILYKDGSYEAFHPTAAAAGEPPPAGGERPPEAVPRSPFSSRTVR